MSKAEKATAKAAELAAQKEARQAQFLSYFAAAMKQSGVCDAIAAQLKAAKDDLSQILDLASAAGHLKTEIRDLMADAKAPRKDLQAKQNRMNEYRRWLGQPVEQTQTDIEAWTKTPVEVRDQDYWNRIGYNDGLYGRDAEPPEDMEPRFGPHYLAGWNEGQARLIWAQHIKNMPKAEPAPKVEEDAGPTHPSEVTRDEIDEARAALDKLGEQAAEDDFEAWEEELAARRGAVDYDPEAI